MTSEDYPLSALECQCEKGGRETFSALLDKVTAREKARVRAASADYACVLAEIVFRDALGEDAFPRE